MDEYDQDIIYSIADVIPIINQERIRKYINTREALYYEDEILLENTISAKDQVASTSLNSSVDIPVTKYLTHLPIFVLYNPFYGLYDTFKPNNIIIKLDNILWSFTSNDVREKVYVLPLEPPLKAIQDIHFLMDIYSSRIYKNAYVQVAETSSNRKLLAQIKQHYDATENRFKFSISTMDELLSSLFPSWSGVFVGGRAFPRENGHLFVTQLELKRVLQVCKANEINSYSKFCERPYEHLVSIALHIPWYQERIVTTLQRDLIYESFKLATLYLFRHLRRVKTSEFNDSMMEKMLRVSLECPGFTPKQRRAILQNSKRNCPNELRHTILDIDLTTQKTFDDKYVLLNI